MNASSNRLGPISTVVLSRTQRKWTRREKPVGPMVISPPTLHLPKLYHEPSKLRAVVSFAVQPPFEGREPRAAFKAEAQDFPQPPGYLDKRIKKWRKRIWRSKGIENFVKRRDVVVGAGLSDGDKGIVMDDEVY
jgi:hypothetical protein